MYSGGNGTLAEPYLISDVQDLQDIAYNSGSHFKQINDIAIGNYFSPIDCLFTGSYDGNYHYIWDGKINFPNDNAIGLFTRADGVFLNMFFSNIEVHADAFGGMIAGTADNVTNFYAYNIHLDSTCKILGNNGTCHGGIVGYLNSAVTGRTCIERCSNAGPVSSYDSYIGGIIGQAINCSILNCSFDSYVTTSIGRIGGIAGYFSGDSNCKLQYCINKGDHIEISGEYSGGDYAGGIVGQVVGTPVISNCFALNQFIKVDNISATNVGRILGNNTTNDSSNYALDTMYFYNITTEPDPPPAP